MSLREITALTARRVSTESWQSQDAQCRSMRYVNAEEADFMTQNPEMRHTMLKLGRQRLDHQKHVDLISSRTHTTTRCKLADLQGKAVTQTRNCMELWERNCSMKIDYLGQIHNDRQFEIPASTVFSKKIQQKECAHQNGYDCLYIAMRCFRPFKGVPIAQLREHAATFIEGHEQFYLENKAVGGEYGSTFLELVRKHRTHGWGNAITIHALASHFACRIMILQSTTKKSYYARIVDPTTQTLAIQTRTLDQFTSFDGPMLLNYAGSHWVALVSP